MKGSSTFYAAIQLLLIAFIANVSQVKALTPEQTCPLVANNTHIGDPNDCQGWVMCINGKAFYGKCQTGQLYDSTTGYCSTGDVECHSSVDDICSGYTEIFKANPNDCSTYFYCYEGAALTQKCPIGQYYDPMFTSCVWASDSDCKANSPCRLVKNGFMSNGKTCGGWIRCGMSEVKEQGECKNNHYFNPNTQECDLPQNVICSTEPTSPNKPPAQIDPVPSVDLCKKAETYYSDGVSCTGYFWCLHKDGKAQYGKCPQNSHFSEDLQQCVDPDRVVCEKNRCDGMTKPFMTKAKTGCREYLNCKNGKEYSTAGECRSGVNIYFNEVDGYCQEKKPDYAICSL